MVRVVVIVVVREWIGDVEWSKCGSCGRSRHLELLQQGDPGRAQREEPAEFSVVARIEKWCDPKSSKQEG